MNWLKNFFRNLFVTWPVACYNSVVNASWKQRGIDLGIMGTAVLLAWVGLKLWPWWGSDGEVPKNVNVNYIVSIDVFGPKETAIFTCGDFFTPSIGLQSNSLMEIEVADSHGFWVSNPTNPAEQGAVAAFDDVCHIVFSLEGQRYRLTSGVTRIKTRIGGPMSFDIGLHPELNPESQVVSGSVLSATTFADFKPGKVSFTVRQVDAFSPYSTAAEPIMPPGATATTVRGIGVPADDIINVGSHIKEEVVSTIQKVAKPFTDGWGRTALPIRDTSGFVLNASFNIVPDPNNNTPPYPVKGRTGAE